MPNRRNYKMSNYWDHILAMIGPYQAHVLAISIQYFWLYLPETTQIFTEESCIPNRRTLFNVQLLRQYRGHISGHIRTMFWLFLQYICLQMTEMAQNFTSHACQIEECSLMLTYRDHIGAMFLAILGPQFGYFYDIFASRCLKWLNFSLESYACHIKE